MQHFLYFLPLLQWQGSFRPILAISPTSFQRTDPVYQALLADARFHEQLLVFDRDLAASARAARCRLCGGALHSGSYARKPRGGPAGLGQEYAERFSFCCAVDGCRKRTTPPSLRFLGRKVYLAQANRTSNLLDCCTHACPNPFSSILPRCSSNAQGRPHWISSQPASRIWKTREPGTPPYTTSTPC